MKTGQELLKEELQARLDAHHVRIARTDFQLEKMEAYQKKTETTEEMESEAEQEEVPKEEAAVETFGALKAEIRAAVSGRKVPR
jgi:hypothetical protein